MIEFEHKLPAMNIDGRNNGTYNNTELAIPGVLTTLDHKLGDFLHVLRANIYSERALLFIDGKMMMVNKNWIRDHVHTMKAMKYFEYDMSKFLDFIIETQREDGQYYELIKQLDDPHWQFVNEDCRVIYPEDNLALVRLEIEADIEYLVVEGAMQCYRLSGDNEWLSRVLPKLEKGINYMTSDKKRWNPELGLVIRAFTVDTWDFTDKEKYTGHDRRIYDNEKMGAMHGDNSGVYQAMHQLAWFNRRLGNEEKALEWEKRAEILKENIFKYLWNGNYFIHQYHIGHDGLDDKEAVRLSLSNTYDMNRKLTSLEQSRSIIEEYMARRKTTNKFAEWFTIDPAYEMFCQHPDGDYINGAISPFTAGELAKAALNNGYEEYGWDIISRFMKLAERDGNVFFLYSPDSTPQPERGPSAWGAAAFISAVDEGLAGIVDTDVKYGKIDFSPKFPVTPYTELRYLTGYEKCDIVVDVKYILTEAGMRYDITSPAREIKAHILLPKGKTVSEVYVCGEKIAFSESMVGESRYVDFVTEKTGTVSMELIFA